MNQALAAIHDYYKAFSTLNLDACAPFFSMPCMFVGNRGTFAVAGREDLAKVLGQTIEALRATDYQRSVFVDPEFTAITENAVLVLGVAVRYRSSGTETARIPIGYLMHQTEAAWKIAVVASAQ